MRGQALIELVLLFVTAISFLALVVKSLITGEDIPPTLAYLIGLSWGGLLGVKEVVNRIGGSKNGDDDED